MISIIMGVYNGEKTLRDALDSILAQTYPDWKLIVCDDCSVDSSLAILREYERKDNRIKVICNKKNVGLAASLNHCLEYVNTKYIARMDCDDLSAPDRLKKQLDFLEKNSEYQLVGTYMQGFDDFSKKEVMEIKLQPTKYDLPKRNPFFHATVMMRTDAMKALNGYCVSKHTVRTEDVDLWYRFFAAGFLGATIPEPLYLVRLDDAAYKRRKLKYMFHASYIIWYGCGMLKLPFYYRIYCFKPILSWLLPESMKGSLRRKIIDNK